MLKPKSAKVVLTEIGYVTLPLKEGFFRFDGTKISIDIVGDKIVKIFRNGELVSILTGKMGEKLNVTGEVRPGDVFLVGNAGFFEFFNKESFNSLHESQKDEDAQKEGASMVTFLDVPKVSPFDSVRKFISERRIIPEGQIFVKNEPGFEPDSKSKKTTLSVGVILLVILGISIGFGIMQRNKKEKENEAARIEQEAKDREASGFYQASPELFLDLTLLSAGFKGDTLSSSGGNLYVLDKNSKKIVSIEIASKKSEVVAGQGELNEAFDMASYEDRVFVLDSEGVKEVGSDITTAVAKDWEGDVLIQAFAGNLYVLDKSAGAIYRYQGGDTGFGSKQNWLSAATKPDFTDVRFWTFDGAIYVAAGSKILKYSQGSPQGFSLASEVLSVDAMHADEENQYLYVLDKQNGKVFVLEKDGKFKAAYSSEEIKNAVNLIASEADKKIILLTGEKLLAIEMRNL